MFKFTLVAAVLGSFAQGASAATIASFSAEAFFDVNMSSATFAGTDIAASNYIEPYCFAECADWDSYSEGNTNVSIDEQFAGRQVSAHYRVAGSAGNPEEEAFAYRYRYYLPGFFYNFYCEEGNPCDSQPSIEVTIDYSVEAIANTSLRGRPHEATANASSSVDFVAGIVQDFWDLQIGFSESLEASAGSSHRNRSSNEALSASGSYTAILRPGQGLGLAFDHYLIGDASVGSPASEVPAVPLPASAPFLLAAAAALAYAGRRHRR